MEIKKFIQIVGDWQRQEENLNYDVEVRIHPGDTATGTHMLICVTRRVGDPTRWLEANSAVSIETLDAARGDFSVTNGLDRAKAQIAQRVQLMMNEGK